MKEFRVSEPKRQMQQMSKVYSDQNLVRVKQLNKSRNTSRKTFRPSALTSSIANSVQITNSSSKGLIKQNKLENNTTSASFVATEGKSPNQIKKEIFEMQK